MSRFQNSRALIIVTGASRGFGRAVTLEIARILRRESVFLLLSRSLEDLDVTIDMVRKIKANHKCFKASIDNSSPMAAEQFKGFLESSMVAAGRVASDFDAVFVVHNAGDLGRHGTSARHLNSMREITRYFSANLFSVMSYNSILLNFLDKQLKLQTSAVNGTGEKTMEMYLVNVSSLMALFPQATWTEYCTGKAARDMYFKVLATEEKRVRVLNYAPGPLDTKMVREDILEFEETDENVRNMFNDMIDEGKLLKAEDSAAKLVDIIVKNSFNSGDHIDFFD